MSAKRAPVGRATTSSSVSAAGRRPGSVPRIRRGADRSSATVVPLPGGGFARPSPKFAGHGVVRVVPPAETIRRVMPLMEAIGVTRIADVTGLDRAGVPNFTSVRPRERGPGISYYNGKGTTRSSAMAGALMEAVERFSAEHCVLQVYVGDQAEMAWRGPVTAVDDVIAPRATEYRDGMRLEWVVGHDLLTDRPTFVPLGAVVCPYEPPPGVPVIHYPHTNGLAAGNTIEEALCHALCEVVERDAVAIADAELELAPAVGRILGGGVPAEGSAAPRFPLIDLDTLPRRAWVVAERMRRAGLQVFLRDVTSTAGVATLNCAIVEPHPEDRYIAHGGSGCHPDARVAAIRALTEAAQSRVGHIQGGREDLPHIVRAAAPFDPDVVYGSGAVRPFSAVPSVEHDDVADDLRLLLDGMARDGFEQVVAVDLTRPEIGVPTARVVVPRAESWSVFFSHVRRAHFGPRVNKILAGSCRVAR